MGVYFLNHLRIRDGIPNQEGLAQVTRTVEAYGGRLPSHREEQGLEGTQANSVLLAQFGTMTEAWNWYNSYEYKDILRLYVDNAIALVSVDGVNPDFSMAGFAPRSGQCRQTF